MRNPIKKRFGPHILAGLFVFTLSFPHSLMAALDLTDSDTLETIHNLPNGIANQKSLMLRYRHVQTVDFEGAGIESRYSFVRGSAIVPEGLSLKLRNRGEPFWAGADIRLKSDIDVTSYNSMVLWVLGTRSDLRFRLTLEDIGGRSAKTDILPTQRLKRGRVFQIAVPYSLIQADDKFQFDQVKGLQFEFGEGITKNPKKGTLDILGIAFVEQNRSLSTVAMAVTPARAEAQASVSGSTAKKTADVSAPKPGFLARLFPPKKKSEVIPEIKKAFSPPPASADSKNKFSLLLAAITLLLLTGAAFAGWFFYLRRRPEEDAASPVAFNRTIQAVRWPFQFAETTKPTRLETDFWRGLAHAKVKTALLSTTGLCIEKGAEDEYYGENFLRRQIQLAKSVGVQVIPSVSLAQTGFNFEIFLNNPKLYALKPIAVADRGLSDDELRNRNRDAFPVWIPPYWQQKYGLAHRVLLASAKKNGNSNFQAVQLDLHSPELKSLAIRLFLSFAKLTGAARVEDAPAHLSSDEAGKNGAKSSAKKEFWKEVISTVKNEYPNFLFIADKVGVEGARLKDAGFDFCENDALVEILMDQIRRGEVGSLNEILSGESVKSLKNSLYDISLLQNNAAQMNASVQQSQLGCALLSLVPGVLVHDDTLPEDLDEFLHQISKLPVVKKGKFGVLPCSSSSVLAFGRWRSRSLTIAVANISTLPQKVVIQLEGLAQGFEENRLYLFSDALHGSLVMKDVLAQGTNGGPALALWGSDLKHNGLPLSMPGLSLRLFSVNLTNPILHDLTQKVRQLHKV